MQEISEHVYIERSYPGVTLGALSWPHGLVLIDAPFRQEDCRAWRANLLNLGGGIDRLLVNLDAHVDRTLGARAMECMVAGHERMAEVFRTRPLTFKTQGAETGAEWEAYTGLCSGRWAPPEITFNQSMQIHWSETPLVLESHPGPASGAIWALLPQHNVAFIGDAVVYDQPPFLAAADLPAWLNTLDLLASPAYQNVLLVGGRNGLVTQKHVHLLRDFLKETQAMLKQLSDSRAGAADTAALVPVLLKFFEIPQERTELYTNRLKWGLAHCFTRNFRPTTEEVME
jgi:glyoxylase-like metal-dependent hydrolase (beta-lactamase superfamily II)